MSKSAPFADELGTEYLSADEAAKWGECFTSSLLAAGLPTKSFVVFQAQNSAVLLAAIYGCLRAELAPVIISASLSQTERDAMLDGLPYAVILRDEELTALCTSSITRSPTVTEQFGCRPTHFTSGTSGRPKGVWSGWLSDEQSDALAREERETWDFKQDDVHLVSGPFSHSAPLRFALHTLLNGGSVLVPGTFNASVASSLIDNVATTAFMAPIHLQRILDAAPPEHSSLRLLAHAGSNCPELVRRRAIACFGADVLVEFYGSTEGQFTQCSASEWLTHPGTVGRARLGRSMLSDKDGRLWCKAPKYARFEYWKDPEKTKEAWEEGWFTVGDLGRVDEKGYVFLEGRRSDLIITGGVNVYPAEIELALSQVEGIEEIVVFGVEDPEWGQRVCAAFLGTANVGDVLESSAAMLAPYKRPKIVIKADELPRTHSGKVDRAQLPSLIQVNRTQ
jgi:acyl-CoA synthetase (AMP-forming)/AMP-acid ligase II